MHGKKIKPPQVQLMLGMIPLCQQVHQKLKSLEMRELYYIAQDQEQVL